MIETGLRKLRSNRGESLVELIVSMLIITMAGMILAGAIMASDRVNTSTAKAATFPEYQDAEGTTATTGLLVSYNIKLPGYEEDDLKFNVKLHQDDKKGTMYYYENAG
ncbi:MAG: hypothetical protein E7211_18520 [Clostridium lundense]|jgi:hypothetical protein|nr:hypothetical protein [Clostridium lundense]